MRRLYCAALSAALMVGCQSGPDLVPEPTTPVAVQRVGGAGAGSPAFITLSAPTEPVARKEPPERKKLEEGLHPVAKVPSLTPLLRPVSQTELAAVPSSPVPTPSGIVQTAYTAPVLEPSSTNKPSQASSIQPVSGVALRVCNSHRVSLAFDAAGAAAVELWYTMDGRSWQKDTRPAQSKSPYIVEMGKEGLYGLALRPCRPGSASEAPSAGELPQVWVSVDWTKPRLQLASVEPRPDGRAITVRWQALDDNLSSRPITVSYAEKAGGPWVPVAANFKNTGSFTWEVPANGPRQVVMRVEATDQVGNLSVAEAPAPLLLRAEEVKPMPTSCPVRIVGIETASD